MHVPRATCASEWIVTNLFLLCELGEISLLAGSHHVGVQADTVRPATNQPYSFPRPAGYKTSPSESPFPTAISQHPFPHNIHLTTY